VGDFFDQPGKGPRLGDHGGGMHGEATHVHFVDDGIFHRRDERDILAPVVVTADVEAAAMSASLVVAAVEVMAVAAPAGSVGDGGAAGIEQHEGGIEAIAAPLRTVDAPAVTKDLGGIVQMDVPKVAGAML